jgi:hypothetical protein
MGIWVLVGIGAVCAYHAGWYAGYRRGWEHGNDDRKSGRPWGWWNP